MSYASFETRSTCGCWFSIYKEKVPESRNGISENSSGHNGTPRNRV